MTLGRLAGHLAELPTFVTTALTTQIFDFRPPGAEPRQPLVMSSRKRNYSKPSIRTWPRHARALAKASDEDLLKTWTLLAGGQTIMTLPRIGVVRGFAINHGIHHRGQLSVYLRLNNVPVPSIYGPSADEGAF